MYKEILIWICNKCHWVRGVSGNGATIFWTSRRLGFPETRRTWSRIDTVFEGVWCLSIFFGSGAVLGINETSVRAVCSGKHNRPRITARHGGMLTTAEGLKRRVDPRGLLFRFRAPSGRSVLQEMCLPIVRPTPVIAFILLHAKSTIPLVLKGLKRLVHTNGREIRI